MASHRKDIIVYVMNLPGGAVESIRRYEKIAGMRYKIMLLWDARVKSPKTIKDYPGLDLFLKCDFSKPHKLAETLLPYQDRLLAITCRSETHIGRFATVLPQVPYLRTPTTESLRWASDKYEMRKRLRLYDPKVTPKFTLVKENSKKERKRVAEKVSFPMIIKPTNLAGSLFVSICYHEEELEKTLRNTFKRLRKAYENDKRLEEPKVIAEEYLEGDLYSVDSYINSRGEVYHCPLVRQITAKNIGREDFYNYIQITPSTQKKTTVEKAHASTETALHALGLRNTTAHTELMKVDDEWKVIEVGARMGGFRHVLHELSCDIDHSLNDILIRIPKKPIIPKKCQGYAATIKWCAEKEGVITEMKGIKKILELESFHDLTQKKKVGDRVLLARNGGRSIFDLFLYNKDRSKLLADIRRVEQMVKIKVVRGSRK